MKFILKIFAVICFMLIAVVCQTGNSFAQVQAMDPTNEVQEFDIKLDKFGDATYEVSEKMTQAQWENFKSGPLANDPSVKKRDLERSMSTYVIEDFNRTLEEMNRTVKLTFKVKALAQYDGGGKWELKLNSKSPQIVKLADNAYMLTSNIYYGTSLVQQIQKLYFPGGASNIEQTADSFGNTVFTYSKGGGISSYFAWNNILGAILIIAAIVLLLRKQQRQQLSLLTTTNTPPPAKQLPTDMPPPELNA